MVFIRIDVVEAGAIKPVIENRADDTHLPRHLSER